MGALAAGAQYTLLIVLVEAFQWPPALASCCGYGVGAVINYALNRRYTFRSTRAPYKESAQFALVALLGFCLNGTLMFLGTHHTALPYWLVQIFSTLCVLGWNFFANRYWTFYPRAVEEKDYI